jgi:NAD(P)-dependent dehydrogenase (short-subunit alcohol dehydrogenase family)
MQHYIIVGSSRGLGAALVNELLSQEASQVMGIARTKLENIPFAQKWLASGRYRHFEVDIGSEQASHALQALCTELPPLPVCVIFNAAYIQPDVNANQSLNYEVVKQINRVSVDGLVHVLEAFESHLLTYGGNMIGISSVWGTTPPVYLPWVAYPTSKAYLNMLFRCLKAAWRNKVRVVTVHLGVIGGAGTSMLSRLAVPTYQMAASKIVSVISASKRRTSCTYPLWQAIVYRMLKCIPDTLLLRLFSIYAQLRGIL